MIPEKGTGEVLSENPLRAKGDRSTNKDQDTSGSLVLLLCVLTLLSGEWELSYMGQAPARTTFLFSLGCPLTLTEIPDARKHAAL